MSKRPAEPETEADGGNPPAPPSKSKALIVGAIAAISCGAAGGATYFLAPTPFGQQHAAAKSPSGAHEDGRKKATTKAEPHGAKNGGGGDESASPGDSAAFIVRGDIGVFVPRPVIVSLKPQGRIRYLKVGLAIETTAESESAFIEGELRIIDVLNSYLRAVPVSALEDPAAMARIREQIARRVQFVVDTAPVNAVLITDFILS